jgi:hypothetical protein
VSKWVPVFSLTFGSNAAIDASFVASTYTKGVGRWLGE